jgi:hypothetical protein
VVVTEGEDVEGKIRKKNLIIVLPLQVPKPSATGKTLVIASSHGVKQVQAKIGNREVWVVASAFLYPKNRKTSPQQKTEKRAEGKD